VFKLEEIDEKSSLLRPGDHVLDLGAAPGSWSMYAARQVGAGGRVLAIDLQEIEQGFADWVTVVQADAFTLDESLHAGFAPYDVVLSDMAPKTGGDKFTNAARSHNLFEAALEVALRFGKPGSHFVGKLFMGQDFNQARQAVANSFARVKVVKPKGTRTTSVEVFLVGLSKKL
jgi:23S rRNA (uridine2552-2'-O)-methyltransferase